MALDTKAKANEWGYALAAIRCLQALSCETLDPALEILKQVLAQTQPEGFLRTFVDAGPKMVPLLREAARRGLFPEYTGHILAAFQSDGDQAGSPQAAPTGDQIPPEPLSERELEVLRLVAAGLTNRQIAEHLFISLNTVKSHIHHLCSKLEASNRTQAVAQARQYGLL